MSRDDLVNCSAGKFQCYPGISYPLMVFVKQTLCCNLYVEICKYIWVDKLGTNQGVFCFNRG